MERWRKVKKKKHRGVYSWREAHGFLYSVLRWEFYYWRTARRLMARKFKSRSRRVVYRDVFRTPRKYVYSIITLMFYQFLPLLVLYWSCDSLAISLCLCCKTKVVCVCVCVFAKIHLCLGTNDNNFPQLLLLSEKLLRVFIENEYIVICIYCLTSASLNFYSLLSQDFSCVLID